VFVKKNSQIKIGPQVTCHIVTNVLIWAFILSVLEVHAATREIYRGEKNR